MVGSIRLKVKGFPKDIGHFFCLFHCEGEEPAHHDKGPLLGDPTLNSAFGLVVKFDKVCRCVGSPYLGYTNFKKTPKPAHARRTGAFSSARPR